MKLVIKERIGGKLKRKYDTPKTSYQRLLDSRRISEETRRTKAYYIDIKTESSLFFTAG